MDTAKIEKYSKKGFALDASDFKNSQLVKNAIEQIKRIQAEKKEIENKSEEASSSA